MDPEALFNYLAQFVQERRRNLIEEVICSRTRYMSILLEDVYQSKNISAVLRTAECLGIQDVHIIENRNKFEYNPYVTRGADKWLTIKRYNKQTNNTETAIHQLKKDGYRLIVTSPNLSGSTPETLPIENGKFVLAFGTEWEGASDILIREADELLRIPMVGYTESLNLSVSAAIIMYSLSNRLRNAHQLWQLSQEEKATLKLEWIKIMVKKPELLINNFLNQNK